MLSELENTEPVLVGLLEDCVPLNVARFFCHHLDGRLIFLDGPKNNEEVDKESRSLQNLVARSCSFMQWLICRRR